MPLIQIEICSVILTKLSRKLYRLGVFYSISFEFGKGIGFAFILKNVNFRIRTTCRSFIMLKSSHRMYANIHSRLCRHLYRYIRLSVYAYVCMLEIHTITNMAIFPFGIPTSVHSTYNAIHVRIFFGKIVLCACALRVLHIMWCTCIGELSVATVHTRIFLCFHFN